MPKFVQAHQALYGYRDGHRLLASSRALEPDTQRSLRSASDTSFDSDATASYLTIYPLPSQGLQAFVRTWPAKGWVRPGSVWSHVLLVEHRDLAKLEGLRPLREAFRRPEPKNGTLSPNQVEPYKQPLDVAPHGHVTTARLDSKTVSEVILRLYLDADPVRINVADASDYDSLLFAVYEQQWPKLRRTFSARTRSRPSSTKVDLEVSEGRGTSGHTEPTAPAPWLTLALADLARPNEKLRSFLRLCGAESTGRADFVPLTSVFAVAQAGVAAHQSLSGLIVDHFPGADTQRNLKRMLFGEVATSPSLPGWDPGETTRLQLAFHAAEALDFRDLRIGERLVEVYRSDANLAAPSELDLQALSPSNVEALVSGIVGVADRGTSVALASDQPDLGLLIVSQAPSLLADSTLWEALDEELLLEILTNTNATTLREVLDALLDQHAVEALARICASLPEQWWLLLARIAEQNPRRIVERAHTLRYSLERMGTAALESPPSRPSTAGELLCLMLAADLSTGLWRRARTTDWLNILGAVEKDPALAGLPKFALDRLFAVALVSASNGSSATNRIKAWSATFGFLHKAMANDQDFDPEAWTLLSGALPAGNTWDRCQRLRRGAVNEVRRDKWEHAAVQQLLAESQPHEGDLLDLLRQGQAKKKKDNWLKSLIKFLQSV